MRERKITDSSYQINRYIQYNTMKREKYFLYTQEEEQKLP